MGHFHIENLYKDQTVMLFKEVAVLEKIDGTSSRIVINQEEHTINYFTGATNLNQFKELFDEQDLWSRMKDKPTLKIYGEHYGGKIQGQSKRYGVKNKFVAFDVKIGKSWLNVVNAEKIVLDLGLEFVHYEICSATLENLDYLRDTFSMQAVRNGIIGHKTKEGIVIRPLIEMTTNNGKRVIAKHKHAEFSETKTQRELREHPEKQASFDIADEWVTMNRLHNILSHHYYDRIEETPKVISKMIEDVLREGNFEVQDTKENRKAIGGAAARLFKRYLVEKSRSEMA